MTTVILLHGVGGNGAGMRALGDHLGPGLRILAPDGPLSAHPGHHAWFDIAGISAENRPARVRGGRAALDALIDAAGPGRVVLLGFSQGAIMALDAVARGKVAEAICFAGRLAFDGALTPQPGARALLVGGTQDHVIPAAEVLEAGRRLQAAGVAVQTHVEEIGHQVGPEAMARARAFLQ